MHIKQIIIDGFKSYAHRTVINDFDPQFNAITGLNGSGKSNILDAICFVLGIKQLSQVRVSNLQGLVYKQGQSGVTKASVTIVFDNSDPKKGPVGYEHEQEITVTRQIAIGSRNKFMINGKNVQAKQVQNLFHTVQLNVNNPHFLIMQGRITKVLNMKPPEILGMVEEAAGTKMFEAKKAEAERKMETKQVKVDEIEKVLAEEITPKLDKLRSERQTYLRWAAQNTEMERLQRFSVAHRFTQLSARQDGAEQRRAEYELELTSMRRRIEVQQARLAEIRSRESEMDSSALAGLKAELDKLQAAESKLSKALLKLVSDQENAGAELEESLARSKKIAEGRKAADEALAGLEAAAESADTARDAATAEYAAAKKAVEGAKADLQAAHAGLAGGGGGGGGEQQQQQQTMQEKLAGLQSAAKEAATTLQRNELVRKTAGKELAELAKQLQAAERADAESIAECASHDAEVARIEARLEKLGFDAGAAEAARVELVQVRTQLADARDRAEALAARLSAFDFSFSDPSSGFDRSRVKGTVGRLVRVAEAHKHGTALEVAAGGKLYHVVVDSADTGKALLKHGRLQRRVNIIPLDKVTSRPLGADRAAAAAELAAARGGMARPAIELVAFDDELRAAMESVFGSAIVCDSLSAAKAVTFDRAVRARTVTLDGDTFDPAGTLSGGSRPSRGAVLVQLAALHEAEAEVARLEQREAELNAQLEACKDVECEHHAAQRELSLARRKRALVKDRMRDTSFGQLQEREAALQKQVEELEASTAAARAAREEAEAAAAQLEEQMQDMGSARERLVADAKAKVETCKERLVEAEAALNAAAAAASAAAGALETAREQQAEAAKELELSAKAQAETRERLEALGEEVDAARRAHEDARVQTETQRDELKACSETLRTLSEEAEACTAEMQSLELKMKTREGELGRMEKAGRDTEKELRALRAKHPWIASEKQFFGKPHTDYDFEATDPAKVAERLQELESTQNETGDSINKKVMGMIGMAEQEYEDLHKKRAIIEQDRKTIERVIKELEAKKKEALETTWAKVNKDFGSIFSTLLPGTQAKLEPPEGESVQDGLEVKVAFGQTWKKSLSELSGGQRSLLALSLILALLLFKPAPMYILDEVDAALDLSHTQNIGQMLRTHFAHSQFIVVSLKEGMFNNANVIFRTKFVDGLSTVSRSSNAHNVARLEADQEHRKGAKKRVRGENVVVN